jgi:hypothetical protein
MNAESKITTAGARRFIIYVMSESSLHLLGTLGLRSVARRALGRLFSRRKREPAPDLALIPRAASAIREYAREHAALFERAQRLREKAERLERAGTPSESAANRAERARMEVEAGLLALRASFASSVGGSAGERAFDHEVERLYPTLGAPGQ